jgi:hypothetical protein
VLHWDWGWVARAWASSFFLVLNKKKVGVKVPWGLELGVGVGVLISPNS